MFSLNQRDSRTTLTMTVRSTESNQKWRRGLLDRIKFDGPPNVIVWKYPHEDIRLGSQLIVHESQCAVLVFDGEFEGLLGPGHHTLTTPNLPLVSEITKLPFNGKSPRTAEVWFLNRTGRFDIKFGIPTPWVLHPDRDGGEVNVRAHGTVAAKIVNVFRFLRRVVGTSAHMTAEELSVRLRDLVASELRMVLTEQLGDQAIGALNISSCEASIAAKLKERIDQRLRPYGLKVVQVASLNLNASPLRPRNLPEPRLARVDNSNFRTCSRCCGLIKVIRNDCEYCGARLSSPCAKASRPDADDRLVQSRDLPSAITNCIDATLKAFNPLGDLRRTALQLPGSPEELVSHFAIHVGGVPLLHYGNIHYQACEAALTKLKIFANHDPRLVTIIQGMQQQLDAKPRESDVWKKILLLYALFMAVLLGIGFIAFVISIASLNAQLRKEGSISAHAAMSN